MSLRTWLNKPTPEPRALVLGVKASPDLQAALQAIGAAVSSGRLLPELLERIQDALKSGTGLLATVAFDDDRSSAARAGNLCVVLEPTEALLELAMAARAGDFDLGIKHGVAP